MNDSDLLLHAAQLARAWLDRVDDRHVGGHATPESLRAALGGPLPDRGVDPRRVVDDLVRDADPGIVATNGPRYFGFVIGGSSPVSLAADWLASTWDQNAGIYATSPASAVVEEVAAGWLLDLFGLPAGASVGFVTGCQMANFTALAAARHALLRGAGWDVERRGLYGAPEIQVVVGAEAHVTIFSALRLLGLGSERVHRVPVDDQGRMRPEELVAMLQRLVGPTLVCAQVGNVDTGACDPLVPIVAAVRAHGGWLHVDGAFGLWAAASPRHRAQVTGLEQADSWSTDAHKWLNVPFDSGLVIVADSAAHRAAMTANAAYLVKSADQRRDPLDWVPEFSRRARGFAVYAALRALGRDGVAALVDRCCDLAQHAATRLAAAPGVEVRNDVVLNQVLVRFHPAQGGDADAFTRTVIERVQQDGTCWLGGTVWQGAAAMRISVSNASTTMDDVDRSVDAILRAAQA
jgi:glutamate/tyrosine decarboxylase-like PLP-dependent enzyme